MLSGGFISGIEQVAAGADICLRGTGLGTDFIQTGAEVMALGSKLCCLLTGGGLDCSLNFVMGDGAGAGRNGCGGIFSSTVHGGVDSVVCPNTNSLSYV